MDKNIVQKLAVERCRISVSHLCALMHLSEEGGDGKAASDVSLMYGLFENLNRDLQVIEDILAE